MSNVGTWGEAEHTLRLIREQKATAETIRKLHEGYLSVLVRGIGREKSMPDLEAFTRFLDGVKVSDTFTLLVDCSQSVESMIQAANFREADPAINSRSFPLVSDRRVIEFDATLFRCRGEHLALSTVISDIASILPANSYSPAKIEHLLAFAQEFPKEQERYNIVAPTHGNFGKLGTFALVPALTGSPGDRRLHLFHARNLGAPHTYVLAVRHLPRP